MPNLITRHGELFVGLLAQPAEDSALVLITFTPSGTDAAALADTNTARVSLSFSAIEVPPPTAYIDVGTAAIKFTVSGTDLKLFEYSDSGSVRLSFGIAAVEVAPPIISIDAGTIYLDFDFGADDCHSILTPHWDVFITQRWQIAAVHQRWNVTAVHNRWALWVIGVAIDNPCPEPEFPEQVFAGDVA
jgi:hypothetical protein